MPEGFDTYRDGSVRAARYVNPVTVRTPGSGDAPYHEEGTHSQGFGQIMQGAGDIISGGMDVATHPLAVGAIAGYYAGKKKFTGSFRPRGGKGGGSSTPDGGRLPPDDDGPPSRPPPPPPYEERGYGAQEFEGHVGANEYLGIGADPAGNAEGRRRQEEGAMQAARDDEEKRGHWPDSWKVEGDPDSLSIPPSVVLGDIDNRQIMLDASSTGGGQTDSILLDFNTDKAAMDHLKGRLINARAKRQRDGTMFWSMHEPTPEPPSGS
jgi:hypothetical protein